MLLAIIIYSGLKMRRVYRIKQ